MFHISACKMQSIVLNDYICNLCSYSRFWKWTPQPLIVLRLMMRQVWAHSSIRSYSPLGTGAGALWPPEPRCRIAPQKSASSKWCRWGEGDARWGKWGGPIDQPPFLATGTQNQAGPDCHDTRWGIWGGPLLPASFSGHRRPPPCPGTECELFFIIFGWNNPHFGYLRAYLSV